MWIVLQGRLSRQRRRMSILRVATPDQLAVVAVECACEAAGPETNISAIVTAALL